MSFGTYNSSILAYNASIPSETQQVQNSSSAAETNLFNSSASNTETVSQTEEKNNDKIKETQRNIDINKLSKEYKENPAGIINYLESLGIKFTNEQKAVLTTLLSSGDSKNENKKNIKSFLQIVKQSNLTSDDILAGMQKVAEKESSDFFKRVGNVFKTLFKEGFTEAFELAKSEQVYYSDKLGSNMSEIREEREDFTSEGLADIADAITTTPEIKDDTMHFVEKEQTNGDHLYTENDVTKVTEILTESPDKAEDFTANAVELEAIKDKNNNIKYDGSTIINVDEKMIENEELKPTMMNTAKKEDMTDDYLIGITDNLVENPEMQTSLDIFLNLKDKDGKDRFSAKNIYDQASFMVNKNEEIISQYTKETLQISKYDYLNGDNIVSIAGNVTDNPEIRDSVYERLNTGSYSGNDIQNYTQNEANNKTYSDVNANSNINTTANYSTESVNTGSSISESATTNPIKNDKTTSYQRYITNMAEDETDTETNTSTVEINGSKYDRKSVQQAFYKKFGTVGDTLLSKLEEDPKFIETVKQYSDYPVILEAIAQNPSLVNKLLCTTSGLSKNELAEILPLCTNSQNTNLIISLTEQFGAAKAVMMFTAAKNSNTLDKAETIMTKNTLDNQSRKQQMDRIC